MIIYGFYSLIFCKSHVEFEASISHHNGTILVNICRFYTKRTSPKFTCSCFLCSIWYV